MVEICRNLENRLGKGLTVSSQLTRFGVKALPSKGQSVISLLVDTHTLASMRKARRCLAFLYGVGEDAIEAAAWHDSPMAAKEEYGCITTTFKRPDWTGANTPNQRTGTGRGLSGTGWTIIGTTATDNFWELLARLPKLRKDARANVETVLHELIADKNATIPLICARTGMALRTINNALATLRTAKIILPRHVAENSGRVAEKVAEKYTETRIGYTEKLSETEEGIVALIHSMPFGVCATLRLECVER